MYIYIIINANSSQTDQQTITSTQTWLDFGFSYRHNPFNAVIGPMYISVQLILSEKYSAGVITKH